MEDKNIKKYIENLTDEQHKDLENSLINSIQALLDANGGFLDLTKGENPLPNIIIKSVYDSGASSEEIKDINIEIKKRYNKK